MNINKFFIWMITGLCFMFLSCDNEEDALTPSEEIGIKENFMPGADASAKVKEIYEKYGVWVRMDFEDPEEVENALLDKDAYNRGFVEIIDDEYRESAYKFIETLLGQVPGDFTRKYFPLDIFMVKSYGPPWWGGTPIKTFGRSRFLMNWPNSSRNVMEVNLEDFEYHYYQDTVLTKAVWSNMSRIISLRFELVEEIQAAGWAYTKEHYGKINEQYEWNDPRRKAAYAELAKEGGFITAAGSQTFEQDISDWITLLATSSYNEIKEEYLDNSPNRAAKYIEVIKFINSLGWDIQAVGDLYSEMKETHKIPADE